MAEKMRYNKIIDLLEHGKPVLSTNTVPNGSLDDLTYVADADYDAVIIEMEHEGFSFTTLRTSLQVLLNRKRIASAAWRAATMSARVRFYPSQPDFANVVAPVAQNSREPYSRCSPSEF